MKSKSNQIVCKDILQIFYKDNPLQFLLDLEKSISNILQYLLQQI